MGSVYTPIIDKIDRQIEKWVDRMTAVDPWLQKQAKDKIDALKDAIEHGGHCPYSELFIPPPKTTGVR